MKKSQLYFRDIDVSAYLDSIHFSLTPPLCSRSYLPIPSRRPASNLLNYLPPIFLISHFTAKRIFVV